MEGGIRRQFRAPDFKFWIENFVTKVAQTYSDFWAIL